MDNLIEEIKNKKTDNKNHNLVIDEAIYYLEKAKECLTEGLENPEHWNKENLIIAKTFTKLFPQMYLLQEFHRSQIESEEN